MAKSRFGATAPPSADFNERDVSKRASQSQVYDKIAYSADVQKQMQTLGILTNEICGQEYQHQPFVSSTMP